MDDFRELLLESLCAALPDASAALWEQVAADLKIDAERVRLEVDILRREHKARGEAPPRLMTDRVMKGILKHVREGAYPHKAAVAMGLSARTWSYWKASHKDVCREYMDLVEKADAEARIAQEQRIYRENPEMWLQIRAAGGGIEDPGWAPRPTVVETSQKAVLRIEYSGDWRTPGGGGELKAVEARVVEPQQIEVEAAPVKDESAA